MTKRYIPRNPRGGSEEHLAGDTRHQAIANIKGANPSTSIRHWEDLKEAGWLVLDSEGPPQIDMF